ncbi:MAG: GNAT family N-acetyltransferase [Actinomycetota bacterium]
MSDPALVLRIERAWAVQETAFAAALARHDPTWGTQAAPIADGVAVLCGPGLFLNRVLGSGLEADLDDRHLDELERLAADVRVVPAVEVCEATRPSVVDLLTRRGYAPADTTSALAFSLTDPVPPAEPDADVELERVTDDTLPTWQEATALGWGLTDPGPRRASDAFATAAHAADRPGLLLARSASDGRVLGCASLRIGGDVATLGGASTLPAERRTGVQRALIDHRLRLGHEAGCTLATTAAEPGSASERNLLRAGFAITHTKTTYELGANR